MNPDPDELVLFQLYRKEDESGVSGEGTVAFGLRFPEPNGGVVLGWMSDQNSVAIYDSIADVEAIHGHGGATVVIEMDTIDIGPR